MIAFPTTAEIENVAMKSPEHLARWLEESGRPFIILKARDWIESLPSATWAEAVETMQFFISGYRDQRRAQSTGLIEDVETDDPETGGKRLVPTEIMKGEMLEPEELDALIEWAHQQKEVILTRREKNGVRPK